MADNNSTLNFTGAAGSVNSGDIRLLDDTEKITDEGMDVEDGEVSEASEDEEDMMERSGLIRDLSLSWNDETEAEPLRQEALAMRAGSSAAATGKPTATATPTGPSTTA